MIAPCPFCGESNSRPAIREGERELHRWECWSCGANGPWASDEETARKRWNKRPEVPRAK